MIYGMGYSGHGAQISTFARRGACRHGDGPEGNEPSGGLDWPAIPMHSGNPWFLPVVGAWFRSRTAFPEPGGQTPQPSECAASPNIRGPSNGRRCRPRYISVTMS